MSSGRQTSRPPQCLSKARGGRPPKASARHWKLVSNGQHVKRARARQPTHTRQAIHLASQHARERHATRGMAHAARVSELADNLIQSLLGIDKTHPSISQRRSTAAKGLRDNSYGRTNQFEVRDRLIGLVKKFAVLNRDDLSDALQSRLEELPTEGKWLPEILALFLSLSNRPVEKTPHGVLETLHAEQHPEEQLTWEEILADDPLDEPGIWDNIDRGYHSSGDETGFEDDVESEPTTSTQATTVNDDSVDTIAKSHVSQPDAKILEPVKQARRGQDHSLETGIPRASEITLIRESLSMLRGLPTDIYALDTLEGSISTRSNVAITTACGHTINDALTQFATLGNDLQALRRWARTEQSRPYIRTCQASTEQLLTGFGKELAVIEERYVGNSADVVVSLIEVLAKTQSLSRHLSHVASITGKSATGSPFALLDVLYDSSCAAQLIGDDEAFAVLTSILFEATQTYLRPVASWISNGSIPPEEHDFFVSDSGLDCRLGDLWHSKYVLRLSEGHKPSTPGFMQDSAAEIFALGKAKMFLDHLTRGFVEVDQTITNKHSGPDFVNLRLQIEDSPLLPFSELFHETVRHWISSISIDVTPNLKSSLLEQHGLLKMLAAIDAAYSAANGALFRDFSDSLFERIMRTPSNWPNGFLLTELARETLGESPSVEPESLSIEVDSSLPKPDSIAQALHAVHMTYHISWPTQNITREASPEIHSKAFVLLLQISHAYRILHPQKFTLRKLHSATTSRTLNTALKLRHSLLALTGTLRTHVATVFSVLNPSLRTTLLAAKDIDAMVVAYSAHKRRLETSLLLSPSLKPLQEALVSALALCERSSPLWELATTDDVGESTQHGVRMSLRKLQKEFDSTLNFVRAGVRSVSRAGGEALLEALAEQLEWMSAS
ncbi:hypothetical protein Q7P37_000572 [Cladosporium fusiforme]